MKSKGYFITFEGPEGSGKTTHSNLLRDFLETQGYPVLKTREPGGTEISENIRNILLNPMYSTITAETELFLYLAARAQHVIEKIKPALENGFIVICDRFTDASLAYQGFARGFGLEKVYELNRLATRGVVPDITFLMAIDVERGLLKARHSKNEFLTNDLGDRIEMEDISFHKKVFEGYKTIAKLEPERVHTVSVADRSIEAIQSIIKEIVLSKLKDAY